MEKMEIMMDSSINEDSSININSDMGEEMLIGGSEILIDDLGMNGMSGEFATEKSEISDVTILIIVVSICAILGIVLGIFAGKKSANK